MFVRNCPMCNAELKYTTRRALVGAVKKNSVCHSCGQNKFGPKTLSVLTKQKISKKMKSVIKTAEWKRKIGESNKGRVVSKETREKISQAKIGQPSKLKGRERPVEWSANISKAKMGKPSPFRGISLSEDSKRKMRLAAINRIRNAGHANFVPSYNKLACKIFDYINSELNLNGMHGENGGEFYIEKLGYWVDYYEPNLNLIIEYDEEYHKYKKDKDVNRENEIKQHLNCHFIRITKDTNPEQLIEQIKICNHTPVLSI